MPNPFIIALDLPNAQEARQLVDTLGPSIDFYKVGLELYTAEGPQLVRWLISQNKRVFLDLKMYDIGETVKRAVAVAAEQGVTFLTVHGSRIVMTAAEQAKRGTQLQLLAVTVLTSYDADDLADLGYPCQPADLVALRVRNAVQSGIDGVVCSPLELSAVRPLAPQLTFVTPGVRSAAADSGDQKRIATPKQAIQDGSNYLVIGRQVTRAADPVAEVKKLEIEIS